MRSRPILFLTLVGLLLGTAGCWWDDEGDRLRGEVATLSREVDGLQASLDEVQDRHDRTESATRRVNAILADPEAYGTEEEIAAQLAQMATPDAMMRDDVFGSTSVLNAWEATLFGSGPDAAMDARLDTVHRWVAEDGSQSGSLWVWHGTNPRGHPFRLVGVQVSTHDESGRATEIRVHYPYPAEHVMEAIDGEGTATGALLTP